MGLIRGSGDLWPNSAPTEVQNWRLVSLIYRPLRSVLDSNWVKSVFRLWSQLIFSHLKTKNVCVCVCVCVCVRASVCVFLYVWVRACVCGGGMSGGGGGGCGGGECINKWWPRWKAGSLRRGFTKEWSPFPIFFGYTGLKTHMTADRLKHSGMVIKRELKLYCNHFVSVHQWPKRLLRLLHSGITFCFSSQLHVCVCVVTERC